MSPEQEHPARIGRFDVKRILGRGAMGVVYLAVDPVLGRDVAVKTIHVHPGLSEAEVNELRQRFENEARSAAKLSHSNLVTIFDAGLHGDSLYMAMEYVRGEGLDTVLGSGRVLTYKEVSDLVLQLAGALDHAHAHGIVHRDIKPANVLVNRRGQPKITDFGVAREATSTLTTTGTIIGTPAYMSPEQITGHPVTGASDQFSLAVMLYEMLTGRKPFQGEGATTILYKIVHEEPEPPNSVRKSLPEALDDVLMQALAKDPGKRYPNCEAFAAAVRETLGAAPADSAVVLTSTGKRPVPTGIESPVDSRWTPADEEAATQIAAPEPTVKRGPEPSAPPGPESAAPIGDQPGAPAGAPAAPQAPAAPAAAPAAPGTPAAPANQLGGEGVPGRMLLIGGGAVAAVVVLALVGIYAVGGFGGEAPPAVTGEQGVAGGVDPAPEVAGTETSVGDGNATAAGSGTSGAVAVDTEPVVYSIVSDPPGARVTLDGQPLRQVTPVDVMLRGGEPHSVRIEAPGHDPVSWAFALEDLSPDQRDQKMLFFPLEATVPMDEGIAPPPGGRGRRPPPGRRGPPPGGPMPDNPVRVRGDIVAPEVLERVEPDFPAWAAEQGLAKYVVVELIIDRVGRVRGVAVLSNVHPTLERLAVEAARAWRFAPATRNGAPIPVRHNVSITFRTGQDGGAGSRSP